MSIVTTFEDQCRALCSTSSPDENASRFLVGTQSQIRENLIYLFEYKDDNNSLAKVSFRFPHGESWHLATPNNNSNLLTAVTSVRGKLKIGLYKLPSEVENSIEDDYGLSESPVEKLFDIIDDGGNYLTRQSHWHPDDGDQILTCNGCNLEFWDINQQEKKSEFFIAKALEDTENKIDQTGKRASATDLRWSSLFNCSVVAAAIGPNIYGIDTRIPDSKSSSVCWTINDPKCNRIRSIDFNPNSQYYLASGGDNCRANFWDLRHTSAPAMTMQAHTHWIWGIRYNPFHDQLVLSASSDSRVALMRIQSISSEPLGQAAYADFDDDTKSDNTDHDKTSENQDDCCDENDQKSVLGAHEQQPTSGNTMKKLSDEVINIYEEHDDSVYAVEWATDPWIFASLGYESRLVISKVPEEDKLQILF